MHLLSLGSASRTEIPRSVGSRGSDPAGSDALPLRGVLDSWTLSTILTSGSHRPMLLIRTLPISRRIDRCRIGREASAGRRPRHGRRSIRRTGLSVDGEVCSPGSLHRSFGLSKISAGTFVPGEAPLPPTVYQSVTLLSNHNGASRESTRSRCHRWAPRPNFFSEMTRIFAGFGRPRIRENSMPTVPRWIPAPIASWRVL